MAKLPGSPAWQRLWLDAFILRAGFTQGWENLETSARRMAEQALIEVVKANESANAARDAESRLRFPDTTGL